MRSQQTSPPFWWPCTWLARMIFWCNLCFKQSFLLDAENWWRKPRKVCWSLSVVASCSDYIGLFYPMVCTFWYLLLEKIQSFKSRRKVQVMQIDDNRMLMHSKNVVPELSTHTVAIKNKIFQAWKNHDAITRHPTLAPRILPRSSECRTLLLLLQERMQSDLLRPAVLFAHPGRECLPGPRVVRTCRCELKNL